jgi:thiosulfate/3-mercaptopyruvate sulfurtransferase
MPMPHRLALSTALVASLAATPLLAAPEGWSPLLEPAELGALLDTHGDQIRVLHVTGDVQAGHIPEAGFTPYATWRSEGANPGALRDMAHWQGVVRDLGIDADTPVVVVHAGADPSDMGAAARVYWTLKSLGVQDLALLNGGFAAWQEAGLPVCRPRRDSLEPSDFEADGAKNGASRPPRSCSCRGRRRAPDRCPPDRILRGPALVDRARRARSAIRQPDLTDFFDGNRMVDADAIREHRRGLGSDRRAAHRVSFCNTGHWAAINWFALSELAGMENTRLYAESMAEYAAAGCPLDNAPNRV